MKFLFPILFFALVSCHSKKKKEGASIYLFDLETGIIPDSVFQKDNLVLLHVGCKSYTLYPPLSALSDDTVKMRLIELPERIGELTELKTLIVNCTGIKKLPENITRLKKLQTLDLSLNGDLDIRTELNKIKLLPHLKTLNIFATKVPPDEVEEIRRELKGVQLLYTLDDYINNLPANDTISNGH